MKQDKIQRFWRSAAQGLLGSTGVVLLTFICYRLQVDVATAALLYLIVVVLISLKLQRLIVRFRFRTASAGESYR